MISEEWAHKLELMNKQVDIGFNAIHRRMAGATFTDFIIWESELDKDCDVRQWESLW